jgi:tetratricopeptide (TPR) repeat protein
MGVRSSFRNHVTFSLAFIAITLVSSNANAFTFIPSEQEFARWSDKCRALYLSTTVGKKSKYHDRVPWSIVTKYRNAANRYGGGPWHYCSGLSYRDQAKSTFGNKKKRAGLFKRSIEEVTYTYRTIKKREPWAAEIGVTLGALYRETNQHDKALDVLDEVVQMHSRYIPAYSSRALVLKDMDKVKEAISFLEGIDPEIRESSSEINYFLGIFYADLKDIDNAKRYAEIAYKLGYPLPGLKNKIQRLSMNKG